MKRTGLFILPVSLFLFIMTGITLFAQIEISIKAEPIRFAVIGDRTGSAVPGIYEQIVGEIERLKPDFVITVGDMIEGPENNEERLRNKWTEYLSIISHFSMPIYYTPGNNDIETDFMEPYYREYIGPPYHSFDYKDIHIIVIDNSRWSSSNNLPEKQLNWIKDDLEKNAEAKKIIAFYHRPFWETTIVDGKPDSLHNLFVKYGVNALFSGHYHTYFSGKYDNILYTNVGSSGGGFEKPGPTGLEYHFVWVTVDNDDIFIAPIKIGAVLPWDEVTADENNFVYKAQTDYITIAQPYLISQNNQSGATAFEVNIKNYSQKFRLEDTIRWVVPDGWQVEPTQMPVNIGKDSSKVFNFLIKNNGPIYPLPTLSVNFPYAEGKVARATNALPIARQANCFKADKKPKINGDISESIWKDPVTSLLGYDGTLTTIDSVKFYFSYDNNNLYLAAYCKDSDIGSLQTEVKMHDGSVYSDDCVGFILQPNPDINQMYVIYVNSIGTIFDQKVSPNAEGYLESDESWDCDNDTKTKIGENYWSVELKLPLSQFSFEVQKGGYWGLNMRRKQPRLNDAAHWQIPWRYGSEFLGRLILE